MRIFAGLGFGGPTLTATDDPASGQGRLGHAVWGPGELLRDLELRLGIAVEPPLAAVRVARWAERMNRLAPFGRFYSMSFGLDPLGTARAVLDLRDQLVASLWTGAPIPTGGVRLDALSELELLKEPILPAGVGDRVASVRHEFARRPFRIYEKLTLADSRELWTACWRTIFSLLEQTGTTIGEAIHELPGAAPNTDLGRVQRALKLGLLPEGETLQGDGSFVLVTAPTSWEAARATAAILSRLPADRSVTVREDDVSALDGALEAHGLSSQGWISRSPWRGAIQVLPLALELAFEPKDPYRALELLTLPTGPFRGVAGYRLTRALLQSPGVGSPAWGSAKAELAKLPEADWGACIAEWFEGSGADPVAGASKGALLVICERVRAWSLSRIASAPDSVTFRSAAAQAAGLQAAIESDIRSTFSLVEVRRLVASVLESGTTVELLPERAGRIDHVSSAGDLRVARENVVWWAFVDGGHTRAGLPWRREELRALAGAGVHFVEPALRLAARANGWRRAIQAATARVILVAPSTAAGTTLAPHPLWDEITARTRMTDANRSRCIVQAHDLLTPGSAPVLRERPALQPVSAALLPGGHAEWQLPPGTQPSTDRFSASGLGALLACPLQWGLRYAGGLRSGGQTLPRGHQLNGLLGHRLVECLHQHGEFDLSEEAGFSARAEAELARLIPSEGAALLRVGMAFERQQLERQLVGAVTELFRILRQANLRIVAVEEKLEVPWAKRSLHGRLDLLVAGPGGDEGILDMKWGYASYREQLRSGQALQLATYAFARGTQKGGDHPHVAYFSLSRGRLLAASASFWLQSDVADAPTSADTWKRVERSVEKAGALVARGRLPATGLKRSLPLLGLMGVQETAHHEHFAFEAGSACGYCELDALCGRRWEATP
jgi:ATP-dependent helicase/nuclease subunit B